MAVLTDISDDCWQLVFEQLNLNERRAVRLTCKRFQLLCDQIKIDKLVIFERRVPLPGRLKHTNEPFGLKDTAYVAHLTKFFDDERLVHQMRQIRALAIYGDNGNEMDLKVKFDQLKYLELRHCRFTSPAILSSAKLECLIFDLAEMRPWQQIHAKVEAVMNGNSNDSFRWYALGLEKLKSKCVKYFSLADCIDGQMLQKAIAVQLFDNLEEADLWLPGWKFITPLVRKGNCPMLKKLNVMIDSDDVQQEVQSIGRQDLDKEFGIISKHLAVHLLGFPFQQQHLSAMVEFFRPFGQNLKASKGHFQLQIDQEIYEHLKKWNGKCDLAQFYRKVDRVILFGSHKLASDPELFRRFSECPEIVYIDNPNPADFDRHLDVLDNLERVHLLGLIDNPLEGKKLLDSIGEKCPRLKSLVFNSCEEIDFGFLFKLPRLRVLNLHLAFPPPQQTLIDLLKAKRDLTNLDICFIRSANESKDELSSFKRRMIETFTGFEERRREFRVQIHTNEHQFVRYLMKIDHHPMEMPAADEERMFALVKYKRDKLQDTVGKKAFEKLFGQPATGDKR